MRNFRSTIILVFLVIINFLVFTPSVLAVESEVDQLLNFLIEKKVVTAEDAAEFRAQMALKKQEEKEKQKEFTVITGRPVKISGYTQVRYRNDETINDGFDIRRARLIVRGDITDAFDYDFQGEFAGSSAKLLDGAFGYKLNSYAKITAGQFKLPFSLENITSDTKLDTINRSQVVEALAARGTDVIGNQNGRDIGVQVGGNFGPKDNRQLFDYAVGVFNGAGINASDTNERKDVVGRLAYHPWQDFSVGGSLYSGQYTLSSSPALQEDREHQGGELAYAHDRISLKGEFIQGRDATIHKDGWYVQGGYFFIPQKFQGVLKFDTFDPDKKIHQNETNVYTLGGSWYFNKWAALQVNYEVKDERGAELDNNAITGQLTLQF